MCVRLRDFLVLSYLFVFEYSIRFREAFSLLLSFMIWYWSLFKRNTSNNVKMSLSHIKFPLAKLDFIYHLAHALISFRVTKLY